MLREIYNGGHTSRTDSWNVSEKGGDKNTLIHQ